MSTLFSTLEAIVVILICILQFTRIFQYPAGKWVVLSLALLACACAVLSGLFSHREAREREQRERERDERFEKLLAFASEPLAPSSLPEKLEQAMYDLFAFLKEKGPLPDAGIKPWMSTREKLRLSWPVARNWANSIAFGYERRFRQSVQDLLAEVRERGFDPAIADHELNPPHGHSADSIRALAEKLGLLAPKIKQSENGVEKPQ